jgi:hypothetical protein
MALYASWTHGNAITVESPENFASLGHVGWGADMLVRPARPLVSRSDPESPDPRRRPRRSGAGLRPPQVRPRRGQHPERPRLRWFVQAPGAQRRRPGRRAPDGRGRGEHLRPRFAPRRRVRYRGHVLLPAAIGIDSPIPPRAADRGSRGVRRHRGVAVGRHERGRTPTQPSGGAPASHRLRDGEFLSGQVVRRGAAARRVPRHAMCCHGAGARVGPAPGRTDGGASGRCAAGRRRPGWCSRIVRH